MALSSARIECLIEQRRKVLRIILAARAPILLPTDRMLRRLFSRKTIDTDAGSGTRVERAAIGRLTKLPVENLGLYERALVHRSFLRSSPQEDLHSNERLEYLGDAVIGLIVAQHLFRRFPNKDEGFLTRLRAKLVNGRALAQNARHIKLGKHILMSESMSGMDGRASESVLSDAFEAIIGAIYLDQGLGAATAFVERTVLRRVNLLDLARRNDNFKSALLEHAQARKWPQPIYRVSAEAGPSHQKIFTVAVLIGSDTRGTGKAGSKKKAEQIAAKSALEKLEKEESANSAGPGD